MEKEVIALKEVMKAKKRSDEFFPINWYKEKLEKDPVYFHEETNTWNVFKYKHVKEVLSNYKFFSSEGERTTISVGTKSKEGQTPDKVQLTSVDPPAHRKGRSLLSAAFTPRSLKEWEPRIRQVVRNLLDNIEENSENDIVQVLTGPLPAVVMADLFGLSGTDQMLFKKWVDILFQPFDKNNQADIEAQKQKAAKEYYEYLYPYVAERRFNLSDDIISDLIRAEVDGEKFTDDEIVRITMMILGAGIETTSHMLANTFYALLYDDQSIYKELRANIELVPNTVEEMLRYRFHMSRRDRTVKQDNDLLGVPLKKGDVVIAWMSAANVDEEVFENPFSLDIHRSNNKKHLTFGSGAHFCLGAPLARLEGKIALEEFVQRFSKIEPVEGFELEENLTDSATGQSLTHLPLKIYK
ncbi:cytochrome P450 [Priestia endophytica]|uniref:cytochrome P450 n=1 Tax=Priestia endophytica TaxID=135735 RepID=UPI002040C453|nr:cytochrome P450 [Priestia endophytica]MCM3537667.1 cytochrome P450 [Priestia endophytica]